MKLVHVSLHERPDRLYFTLCLLKLPGALRESVMLGKVHVAIFHLRQRVKPATNERRQSLLPASYDGGPQTPHHCLDPFSPLATHHTIDLFCSPRQC